MTDSDPVKVMIEKKALELCANIIEEERDVCFHSYTSYPSGKVCDREGLYYLRRYDRALKALREALAIGEDEK